MELLLGIAEFFRDVFGDRVHAPGWRRRLREDEREERRRRAMEHAKREFANQSERERVEGA